MIRLSVVSYLNSKPFTEGLTHRFSSEELEIQLQIPSLCAKSFYEKRSQIALIPTGSLLDFDKVHLLDDYCIGADGSVDSVYLFAQQPVETIEVVYLDWHSRTSNGLTKILFKHLWKQEVQFVSELDYFNDIQSNKAGVIIGDRAIEVRSQFRYAYDLAKAWKQLTGLPFVFAVWAFHAEHVSPHIQQTCKDAFAWGLEHRKEIAHQWANHFGMTSSSAENYLMRSIDYDFNDKKKDALQQYLVWLAELEQNHVPQLYVY